MKKLQIKKDPVFFQNKDFQTIMIKMIFPFKRREEDLALLSILPNLLNNVDAKYPTEREFAMEHQKLLILSSSCNCSTMGEEAYFTFHLIVPDPKAIHQDLLEEQFSFFSEMIYHPKIKKNAFCTEEVMREIQNQKMDIEHLYQDTYQYSFLKGKELVDPTGRFASSIYNHPELIDSVTEKSLYEFYLRTIYHNQPMIYIFGNGNTKELKAYCRRYLYREDFSEKQVPVSLKNYLPVRESVLRVTEESSFQNSVYLTFYKVKDMKEEDEVLLNTIQGLLSSQSSRILYKKLRDENDLVYATYAASYNTYGVLSIASFIHEKNLEFVQEKTQEALDDLKNPEIISPLLEGLKERMRVSIIRQADDKISLFQDCITKDLGFDLTSEEQYQKLLLITPSDIASFMERLVFDTEYFLKEGDHV